jgi:hypothetical protein
MNLNGRGEFRFPSNPRDVQASGNSQINVAGGTGLTGFCGNASIVIAASGQNGAFARIPFGQPFASSGNIMGSSGQLNIEGIFTFTGLLVESSLNVTSGGSIKIGRPTDGGKGFRGGSLMLSRNTTLKIDNGGNGNGTKFTTISSCPQGAQIEYTITTTFAASANANGVIFNYNKETQTTGFSCDVILRDTNNATLILKSSNSPTSRRLLAEEAKAAWTSTSLTWQTGNGGKSLGSGASTASSTATVISALFVIATVIATLF